jgi:N-acetylglucosamine-6-sulfatase
MKAQDGSRARSKAQHIVAAIRVRRPVLAAIAAALLAVVGAVVLTASHARTAGAALSKPNIVYILTDDQTMESVSKMPYVSSRTDWIQFNRAYINNSLCCPSRASILTGQFDTHTGVGNNAQDGRLREAETLPVWLQKAGYQTGLFGKYLNEYPFGRGLYVPPGWNEWQVAYWGGSAWDFYKQYHWKLNSNGQSSDHLYGASDYEVSVLTNKMTAFMKAQATAHHPFYAEFTPTATHGPWKASPSRVGTMTNAPVTRNPNFDYVANNQPAYLKTQPLFSGATMDVKRRQEWEGAASVDDAIKKIDDTLRSTGVYNHTVEIFMTDNGYAFGDHRWERKRCEFNECGQTPMLIRYPGLAAKQDNKHLVTNVDMASTISELAGATPAISQDGVSFAKLILGSAVSTWRDSILLHWPGGDMDGLSGMPESMPQFWGDLGTASDGRYWKYVEVDTGERELYDEAADPNEMTNLYGKPAYATQQRDMQGKLATLKARAKAATGTTPAAPTPLRTDLPTGKIVCPDRD